MRPRSTARGRRLFYAFTLLLLFAAALTAHLRLAGWSPIAFDDTFNDETEVRRCLGNDSCTLVGVQTSIPELYHGVGWLDLRSLVAWLGADIDGAHLLIQILNALAVVLVFHLATRLGGAIAGVAAVCVLMDRLEGVIRVAALYNTSLLLFLGTVFLLACTAAALRPGATTIALAALVAAVLANVHLASAFAGASVVWVALGAPRHRARLAFTGALIFAAATWALAPPGWSRNALRLLVHLDTARHAGAAGSVPDNPMLAWAAVGIGAWLLSLAWRTPRGAAYRRELLGAVAVVAPFLAVFLLAPRFGLFPEPKYIIHLKPAVAVTVALPFAAIVAAPLRWLSPRLLLAVESALPLGLAALLIALPRFGPAATGQTAAGERIPSFADLVATQRILRDDYGWNADDVTARLRTPDGIASLTGLRQLADDHPPTRARHRGAVSVYLLVVDRGDVPDPLPPNWRLLRRAPAYAVVLVTLASRLDWSELTICSRERNSAEEHCQPGSWRHDDERGIRLPNMPPAGGRWRGQLRLSFALLPPPPDLTTALFMPRLPFTCGGFIASAPGLDRDDPKSRAVTIAATASGHVDLVWEIGARECEPLTYDGLPPFFVEGEADAVERIATALERGKP